MSGKVELMIETTENPFNGGVNKEYPNQKRGCSLLRFNEFVNGVVDKDFLVRQEFAVFNSAFQR